MKARIVIYDDYEILDETEAIFTKKQLEDFTTDWLKRTTDAETAEVFDLEKKTMVLKFVKTSRGSIKKARTLHPNWGGRREGGGRKASPKSFVKQIVFKVDEETADFLESLYDKKPAYIRAAINEKRAREKGSQ